MLASVSLTLTPALTLTLRLNRLADSHIPVLYHDTLSSYPCVVLFYGYQTEPKYLQYLPTSCCIRTYQLLIAVFFLSEGVVPNFRV